MAGSTPVGFVPQISPDVPWHTRQHIQLLYQKLGNHALAFQQLKATSGSVTNTTIENFGGGGGGGGGGGVVVGGVNNQTGVTAYTTQVSDNGVLLVVGDASPVTVTLNSGVSSPFFLTIANFGTSVVTLTPSSGTLTGATTLQPDAFSIAFFDGTNWWATLSFELKLETNGNPNSSQVLLNLKAGTNITLSEAGGTVTIAAPGGGGGITRGILNTNANGSWWVWSDGVIEAFGSISVSPTSSSLASGTITFPTAFTTSVDSLQLTLVGFPRSASSDTGSVQASIVSLTFADVNLQCSVPVGGGGVTFDQTVQVMWRAIGI